MWLKYSCTPGAYVGMACRLKMAHLPGMPGHRQHARSATACQVNNSTWHALHHTNTLHCCIGFTSHFAKQGMWGTGNYYSCHPALAVHYDHEVQPEDATLFGYLADVSHIAGMWLSLLACASCCLSYVLRRFHPKQACMSQIAPCPRQLSKLLSDTCALLRSDDNIAGMAVFTTLGIRRAVVHKNARKAFP